MTTTQKFPGITDEALERLLERKGRERPLRDQWNTEVTRDAIRHFVNGIGDFNPLWTDEEYAAKGPHKGVIAPPVFAYTLGSILPQGLPGVHAQFSGTEWEFLQPLRLGDRITATQYLKDVVKKEGSFAGRLLLEYEEGVFRNQRGDTVARGTALFVRHGRNQASEKGKYQSVTPKVWSPEEMAEIEKAYEEEEANLRGNTPRYWEDVVVGEELPGIVRGPHTVTDMIAYWKGCGTGWIGAYGAGYRIRRKQPALYTIGRLGVPEGIGRCHFEDEFARAVGAPAAYDVTIVRVSALGSLIWNWQGDHGWIKALRGHSRRFVVVGDCTYFKGRVVKKCVQDGEHLVEIDCWGENQRGELTTPGFAVVRLPSREETGRQSRA